MSFQEKNEILHCEDVSLETIAADVGTPAYVYSAAHIRSQYEALSGAMKAALPADRQPLICYACKANSNIAVLTLLKNLGSAIETVSEGEMRRALKAGFAPAHIVSEGVGKTAEEIKLGLETGIHQFNIESLGELALINEIAGSLGKTAPVVFRLNPDIAGGGFEKISTGQKHNKFGLSLDVVKQGYEAAKNMDNVEALGIFTHIGSQVWQNDVFEALFKTLAEVTTDLRSAGHTVARIDIGGGFPIQYKDEQLLNLDTYAGLVRDIILPLETEIVLEPGRFLVGNAGILLSHVLYEKESHGRNFLIIDAGMNDLVRPAMYDAYHDIEPVAKRDAPAKTYDIAGPICESSDMFATEREIPAMSQGDLIAIRSAGAYGAVMSSNYNTHTLPAEVLVDGDKYAVIRERQTLDEIIARDKVPDWLT